jgi:hypothetical protein
MKTHPGSMILRSVIGDTIERRKFVAILVRLNKSGADITESQVAGAMINISLSEEGYRLIADFINSI